MGPEVADLLFLGEALGKVEAQRGHPFVGPAGHVLDKVIKRAGLERAELRIDNTVRCQPPKDWLVGAPWEAGATAQCEREFMRPELHRFAQAGGKVVVAVGASPTRRLLGLPAKDHIQANWHGCPTRTAEGIWVVPTFHPSFLMKGNQKLYGTVNFDIQRAKQIASGRAWSPQPTDLVIDPDVAWYAEWVKDYEAALASSPDSTWLAVDIETSGKIGRDEGDLEEVGVILRINFSSHPDQGITVPWGGPWQALTERLLKASGVKLMWNARFDVGVLRDAGVVVGGPVLDFMWAWHVLQSDLPRGLGFVAPFYSDFGAWKHLSDSDPGRYAAIDAVQTIRVAFGITETLKREGQWEAFIRHVYEYDTKVLHPAEEVGLLVDKERLADFKKQLAIKRNNLAGEIDQIVPRDIYNLHPKGGWVKPPKAPEFVVSFKRGEETLKVAYTQADLQKQTTEELVQGCANCGETRITTKHNKCGAPNITVLGAKVDRFYVYEPFNPSSTDQLLKYLAYKGHKAGAPAKGSKSEKGSVGRKVLEGLAKSTKDPLYSKILDYRAVSKVMGTYVEGTERRLGADGRLHAQFLHVPSTMRLSCVNPNLQNVVSDKGGAESLAAGFRNCIVAAPGHMLVAADYAGIEAVETGWYAGDPDYLRLATLGVHAYLTSHIVGEPARLSDSDQALGDYFKYIKKKYKDVYERAKRTVHGTSYGMTWVGLMMNYPEHFTAATAKSTQGLLYEVAPKLRAFQNEVRFRAAKNGFLGGSDHPFKYKHFFFEVRVWNAKKGDWDIGPDGKRCVAFYPQSTAAGVLAETALQLMDPESPYYIGDMYGGRTPIRALVHDDILLEVPEKRVDEALSKLVGAMEEPIEQQPLPWNPSQLLVVRAEAKVGRDWGSLTTVPRGEIGVASDSKVRDWQDEEEGLDIV